MKQFTWLRIIHSGDWCLCLLLRTPSGACQKWLLIGIIVCLQTPTSYSVRTTAAFYQQHHGTEAKLDVNRLWHEMLTREAYGGWFNNNATAEATWLSAVDVSTMTHKTRHNQWTVNTSHVSQTRRYAAARHVQTHWRHQLNWTLSGQLHELHWQTSMTAHSKQTAPLCQSVCLSLEITTLDINVHELDATAEHTHRHLRVNKWIHNETSTTSQF